MQYDLKESFSCYYLILGKGKKKIYQKGVLLFRERTCMVIRCVTRSDYAKILYS